MLKTRIENGGWRLARGSCGVAAVAGCGLRGEGSPQIRRRPQMGMGGGILDLRLAILDWGRGCWRMALWGQVQGSKFRVQSRGVSGFRPVFARKTGFARFCPVFFWVLAHGHREPTGDKVNLELRTRSQGQSNLVKPSPGDFVCGNFNRVGEGRISSRF